MSIALKRNGIIGKPWNYIVIVVLLVDLTLWWYFKLLKLVFLE